MIHSWDLDESEALRIQKHLASKVIKKDQLNAVKYVAGVDVAETAIAEDVARFPYIPGLFSFREIPPIAKALKN